MHRLTPLLLLLACTPTASLPDAGAPVDAGPPPVSRCETIDKPESDWIAAESPGTHRGELAGDLTLTHLDGTTWTLSEHWRGCESVVVIPDTLVVSQQDTSSVWEADIDDLVRASPPNVHYVFVSRRTNEQVATAAVEELAAVIEQDLAKFADDVIDHWRARIHVVRDRASVLDGWLGPMVQTGIGMGGVAIDPDQRLRGVGSFADVKRFDRRLQQAGAWPWKANLALAANEALYLNQDAERSARLAATDDTIVELFTGETLAEFADAEVTLPDAATLARFDTLELEITMRCPDENAPEFGNCGAWDYLAHLSVFEGETPVELARFITTYHREARWTVDASPALALLKDGGTRKFRWLWAPPWNTQPTRTFVRLRFRDADRGHRPTQAVPLWTYASRPFNASYSVDLPEHDVAIPAGAKRVELVAIITGHGAATEQCAEFCNHQHEFTVGGRAFRKDHESVGDQSGCVPELARGMTPNQGGTWWFGRGGWCPGQQVEPWVVDVTELATPGNPLHVSYRGLFEGSAPPDGAGDIHVNVRLVVWE